MDRDPDGFGYVSQVQRNLGKAALLASVLAAGVYQTPAHALPTSITFNFNSLSNGANNTSVQTYMPDERPGSRGGRIGDRVRHGRLSITTPATITSSVRSVAIRSLRLHWGHQTAPRRTCRRTTSGSSRTAVARRRSP